MLLQRENESLVFTLSFPERMLLTHALKELAAKYRLKPDELDARTAAAWYSSRGCASAGMSDEETKEWLEHLHAFKKNTNLQRLEDWVAQLGERGTGSVERGAADSELSGQSMLRIPTDQAAAFMTAINDYRLATAARHDIGQAEMDAHSTWHLAKLPPLRQKAIMEIHFLAWIIEETLRETQA
jgi:hypothetical protein